MMQGIGYQDYYQNRISEGYTAGEIELAGNERYLIYFGRAHLVDHETGELCRGHLKIGRGKFATALMRGRNQPGIDFRIYSEIILETNEATHHVEKLIKINLRDYNMKFSQGQREMYDIDDAQLESTVDKVVALTKNWTHHNILEVNHYYDVSAYHQGVDHLTETMLEMA